MPWLEVARVWVGALLVWAAVAKMVASTSVEPFLLAFGLPAQVSRMASRSMPLAEVSCGALLLIGGTSWSALPAAMLTTGFAAALIRAHMVGVTESCRCFGSLDRVQQPASISLLRSVPLAGVAIATAIAVRGSRPSGVTAAGFAVGALAAAVYVALFAVLGGVVQFRRISAPDRAATAVGAAAKGGNS